MTYRRVNTHALYIASASETNWTLLVSGYLASITGEVDLTKKEWDKYWTNRDQSIKIEIGNWDFSVSRGEFTIDMPWGWHTGGYIYEPPVLNCNTADPFCIRVKNHPALIIRTVGYFEE